VGNHHFCELGDARSFVDPVSTLSHISSIAVGEHLPYLVDGSLRPMALPTALHEAAHHDHFCHAVGVTLAAIHLRVRQLSIGLTPDQGIIFSARGYSVEDLIEWRCRYEAAATVLRPISEGLACLSQFDALPRKGDEGVSYPMQFASVVAARGVPSALQADALQAWLTPARLSDEFSAKKGDLYADGFHCRNGGYLPGYLLVRRAWMQCAESDPRFESAETFLSVAPSVLFGDYRLVELMLSADVKSTSLATLMSARIVERLGEFAGSDLSERYDRLCKYRQLTHRYLAESPLPRDSWVTVYRRAVEEVTGAKVPKSIDDDAAEALLFNSASDVITGRGLLGEIIRVGQTPNMFLSDALAVDLNKAVWQRRGWFWVGSYPVTVTAVGAELVFSGAGGLAGRLPWIDGADTEYMGPGWLTCVYSVRYATLIVAAGTGQTVLAVGADLGALGGAFKDSILMVGEQSALLEREDNARALVDEVWSKLTSGSLPQEIRNAASKSTTRAIAETLLSSVAQADVDSFLDATDADGLAGLVSPRLLRGFAVLSICGSSGMVPDSIRVHLAEHGFDLEDIVREAATFLQPIGGECRFVGDRLRFSL
jgi:hypothetical protein